MWGYYGGGDRLPNDRNDINDHIDAFDMRTLLPLNKENRNVLDIGEQVYVLPNEYCVLRKAAVQGAEQEKEGELKGTIIAFFGT